MATAAPTTPSAGMPRRPKMSIGSRRMFSIEDATLSFIGVFVSPRELAMALYPKAGIVRGTPANITLM